jgi:ATP-binding cassette, subfamily C (CFTR/MRP), member 10
LLTFKKYLDALCCYLWAASPVLISFFSIFSYIISGNLIDAEKVFTTISLLNMTIHPLNVFPWVFAQLKGSKKSFDNILEFLIKEEKINYSEFKLLDSSFNIIIPGGVTINYSKNKEELNNLSSDILQDKIINQKGFELKISKNQPLKFERGKLTMIYGPNGCGKSLILKSILNEADIIYEKQSDDENTVYFKFDNLNENYKISYVPQELWNFNSSLKENITMSLTQDNICNSSKYTEKNSSKLENEKTSNFSNTINNCMLQEDLQRMIHGEETIIASKGSNISGGQKQRVNIARAIYNNPDIILLDNSLSSIDLHISKKILEKAILPLKEENKIVIFATSDKKLLEYCDCLYVVENGKVIKVENIKNYLEEKIKLPSEFEYQNNKNDHLEDELNQNFQSLEESISDNENIPNNLISLSNADTGTSFYQSESDSNEPLQDDVKKVKFETYKFYFDKTGYLYFLMVVIFVGLMQFGRNFIEMWLADWVKAENLTKEEKFALQDKNTKYYVLFIILHSIFTTGRSAYFAIACLKACSKIYGIFIEKIMYAKHKFFTSPQNDVGKLSNLLQSDITTIDEWLPFEFNRLLAYSFGLMGSISVIIFSSKISIIIFIPVGIYYINLFKKYNPACRFMSKISKNINEPFLNLFYDSIEGRVVIRAFNKSDEFIKKFNTLTDKKISLLHTEQYLGFWLSLRLDLLAFYIYSFVMIMIGVCIYKAQYEYITLLSLSLTYALNITSPLSNFLPWITYTEEQFYSVERIHEKIKEVEDERDTKNSISEFCDQKSEKNQNYVENLILEFKNVYLKYDSVVSTIKTNFNTKIHKTTNALENISFQIFSGQKVGIIGRTGAGKSTIFSALLQIYETEQGQILFEGKNICSIDLNKLRSDIVVIPKDVFLIEGSIRCNIDPELKYSEEYFNEFMSFFSEFFNNKPEFELFTKDLKKFKDNKNIRLFKYSPNKHYYKLQFL